MKSNSFALNDLVIAREGAPLTSPINVTLAGGELLAVRGANGSGKSTLLKTIAGLLSPESGEIRINDQWPAQVPVLYLGHKRGLVGSMSVYDNVSFWANMYDCPELIPAALHYFDLEEVSDVPVEQLSAGWQQRVALTRLITIPSPLWLLDEPVSNLDEEAGALLQSLIQSRLEQGGMVLMTSHMNVQGDKVKVLKLRQNKLNVKDEDEV